MKKDICSATAGFFAAAAFAAVGLSVWMAFAVGGFDFEFFLMAPVAFFPIALIVVVVLGVPTFLLLRPFKPGHWSMPLMAGSGLGVLLIVVLPMPILVPLSALSALVFWLVWRREEERGGACGAR
jgi:hypothetical protein